MDFGHHSGFIGLKSQRSRFYGKSIEPYTYIIAWETYLGKNLFSNTTALKVGREVNNIVFLLMFMDYSNSSDYSTKVFTTVTKKGLLRILDLKNLLTSQCIGLKISNQSHLPKIGLDHLF